MPSLGETTAWSVQTVAEGWKAEAEVRDAIAKKEASERTTKASEAASRQADAENQAAEWRSAAFTARAEAEAFDLRVMSAESRAANAEAKLTTAEARAAVAEAQLRMVKEHNAILHKRLDATERSLLEERSRAEQAIKRAQASESMAKTSEERLVAATRFSNQQAAEADSRTRYLEGRQISEIRRAGSRATSAERRAQLCERSSSIVIPELRRYDAKAADRVTSPLRAGAKYTAGVQETNSKTPGTPSTASPQSSTGLSFGIALSPSLGSVSRGGASPTRAQAPQRPASPQRLRSHSPLMSRKMPPSTPAMAEIRAQLSQQLRNSKQY